LSTLAALLTGTQVRAALLVSIVLVAAFTVTGFLSASYKSARESRGREHYERGQALASSGNVQDAAEEYRKALLFMPDQTDYRISLCVALVEVGKLDEADTHLQELLQEDPTDGLLNVMLARVAEKRHKPAQAIEYFQRAVYGYWPPDKLAARHAARWGLVSLLEAQNRRNEVIGELLQLYANVGSDPKEKSKIGFLLLKYGAVSDAMNVFRDLTRSSPRFAEAFAGLAQAHVDQGEYVDARREYQRAVHIEPGNQYYAQQLAIVNSILELDPFLPRLKAAARLSRSKSLLNRVISDLEACLPNTEASNANGQNGGAPANAIADAKKLAASSSSDPDQLSDDLQTVAQRLWKGRQNYCGGKVRPDPVVETVLSRMAS
jgi:tetratricopeptide (TPR) repeat protein